METIILASASPRRQEYFRLLGLPFSIVPAEIDESSPKNFDVPENPLAPLDLAGNLAIKKVQKVIEIMKNDPPNWICGADTIITLDNEIFSKPLNKDDARQMLTRLSGKTHKAITAVALYNDRKKNIDCRPASCDVSFAPLSQAEIEWYLDTNEWQGVAGSYRIQGIAACFISSINGCPSTVAGLPLRDFYTMLKDNGYLSIG